MDNRWNEIAREGNKRERLGQYASCQHRNCNEDDPRCLQTPKRSDNSAGDGVEVLCAECRLDAQGKPRTERHHPAGRANDPFAVPMPANDHAVLGDMQLAWPAETLRNPDGNPLLAAAAALRDWLDVLRLLVDRTVGWIPDFLERMDALLREHVGARWWEALGIEGGRP